MYDFFDANSAAMPSFVVEWIRNGHDNFFTPIAQMLMRINTGVRWGLRNGVWTFGAKSFADYLRQSASYTRRALLTR